MDVTIGPIAPIIAALIALAGSIIGLFLNHHLQNRVREQEVKLDELYARAMSDNLFGQLKKLDTGSFGGYYVDENMRFGLGPELNYLKMIGFIKLEGIDDFDRLPRGKHEDLDLSSYISVTDQGKAFIRLHEKAQARHGSSS